MINTYDMGEKVKITGAFTLDGAPADPAIVRVMYKDPEGTLVTMTYPDSRITKESTGVYSFLLTTSISGYWHYRMDDGGNNVASEGELKVQLSDLI